MSHLHTARYELYSGIFKILQAHPRNNNARTYSHLQNGTNPPPYSASENSVDQILNNLSETLSNMQEKVSPEIGAMILEYYKDINGDPNPNDPRPGQIKLAVAYQAYKQWGYHFLHSLAIAHKLEECNNFMDFGVQNYTGKLFEKLKLEINDIYDELPPPKQSLREQMTRRGVQVNTVRRMAHYNVRGGCFHENTDILLENGKSRKIKNLKKNDW